MNMDYMIDLVQNYQQIQKKKYLNIWIWNI